MTVYFVLSTVSLSLVRSFKSAAVGWRSYWEDPVFRTAGILVADPLFVFENRKVMWYGVTITTSCVSQKN